MVRCLSIVSSLVFMLGCSPPAGLGVTPQPAGKSAGKNVVLWISIDGFRGDYVDRDQSPFIKSLMEHGLYTRELTPVFPSLTFPSHVSEVTGVRPGVHGIVSNKYLDVASGQTFNMNIAPQVLRAEPIWLTATRQGVRTAVIDWPLSEGQAKLPAGMQRSAYYTETFDSKLLALGHAQLMVEKYRADFDSPQKGGPLRLLMGYLYETDKVGHKVGPSNPAIAQAIRDTDKTLEQIVRDTADIFHKQMHPENGDALYILLTTDHGMSDVETIVNLRYLMGGEEVPESVIGLTSGSLAHIYLHQVPASQRDSVRESVLAHLRALPYLRVWRREELPPEWEFDAPGRTGDIIVSLAKGYHFTSKEGVTVAPVESDPKSMRGMHGYDPAENKEMLGFAVLAKYGATTPGRDLGPLDTLWIHPTVAKLLGIEPAPGATAKPIEVLP